MNLIEVQDRLNKLPPLPQSIQYLTTASQGGNPQIPPFMALARISEMNKEIQTAQQQQPPTEPLNQSLPKQAMQSMGIGALQQGQQQQGMQQMAQQAGAAQQAVPPGVPQPVRQQQPMPQGMPQQGPRPMPQGMPQQGPRPMPRGMAGGGLTSIPVDSRMFNYGSGGIVAFSAGDLVEADGGGDGYDPEAELRKLQPQIQASLAQAARPVRSRQAIEEGLSKDYGVDEGPVGKGYLEGLAALKAAKEADRGKQREEIELRKKNSVNRALLDFAEASRGQTGVGGIGALGRSYMGSSEKLMGEEAGLREDTIKTDSLMNEAQYKIQALRQAQKNGDIAAEQKADMDLSRIAKDLGVAKSTLIGRLATGNLNLMGKGVSADATVAAAEARTKNKGTGGASAGKKTDLDKSFDAELAAMLAEGEPDNAVTRKKAMNNAQDRLSKSAGTSRVDVSKVDLANKEFRDAYYDPANRALRAIQKKDPAGYAAGMKALRDRIEATYGVRPNAQMSDAPAPAPKPAAGKQVLPPGTTTGKLVPGKGTEVLKDGKLIGYAN
jgi:hypothetical protein